MKGALTVFLLTALATGLLAAPEVQQTRDSSVTLSFKPPTFKTRFPKLQLSGGSSVLPDGTQIKVNLHRLEETWMTGGRLEPQYFGGGGGLTVVADKKFIYEAGIGGPGKYLVEILYLDDLQRQEISELLKKKLPQKTWQFEFLCWGDELAAELGPKLKELAALANEALDMVKRFEAACKSKETWLAEGKAVTKDNAKLLPKVDNSPLKMYFPAAMTQIFFTIRNLQGTSPYFVFDEKGQFGGGRSYHADNEEIKTVRNEAFSYANLKRYIEESIPLAGREYCLWALKDMRRLAGTLKPDFLATMKDQQKDNTGIAPFFERFEKATISDVDALEADIRGAGAKSEKKPDATPPPPKAPGK